MKGPLDATRHRRPYEGRIVHRDARHVTVRSEDHGGEHEHRVACISRLGGPPVVAAAQQADAAAARVSAQNHAICTGYVAPGRPLFTWRAFHVGHGWSRSALSWSSARSGCRPSDQDPHARPSRLARGHLHVGQRGFEASRVGRRKRSTRQHLRELPPPIEVDRKPLARRSNFRALSDRVLQPCFECVAGGARSGSRGERAVEAVFPRTAIPRQRVLRRTWEICAGAQGVPRVRAGRTRTRTRACDRRRGGTSTLAPGSGECEHGRDRRCDAQCIHHVHIFSVARIGEEHFDPPRCVALDRSRAPRSPDLSPPGARSRRAASTPLGGTVPPQRRSALRRGVSPCDQHGGAGARRHEGGHQKKFPIVNSNT